VAIDRLIPPPWYVMGHQNPDADAICSAIGHAAYLRALGDEEVEAARCGEVPPRVKIVLEQAGLPAPRFVDDVMRVKYGACFTFLIFYSFCCRRRLTESMCAFYTRV